MRKINCVAVVRPFHNVETSWVEVRS